VRYILILFFISGCSNTKFTNSMKIEWPHLYRVYEANQSCQYKKRIYMTYGFGSDLSNYESGEFKPWLDALNQTCHQVIVFSQPSQSTDNLKDGGLAWSIAYNSYLGKLYDEVNLKYGLVHTNIIGGVSFGGLHALMGAILRPDLFQVFFALKPVTDFQQLGELATIQDVYFNPLKNINSLRYLKGYISYDLSDNRVNGSLAQMLLQNIGSPTIYGQQFFNSGHNSNANNLMPSILWLQSIR
jgi:pimeloyl-ACP methyl ester carboxylesterase